MFTGTEILCDWSRSGWIWEKSDLKTHHRAALHRYLAENQRRTTFSVYRSIRTENFAGLYGATSLCTLKPTLAEQPAGVTAADRGVGTYYKLLHRLRVLARREHLFHHEWEHTELSTSGSSTVRKHKSERRGNSAVKTMQSELMRSRWWKGYSEIVNAGRQMKNSKESVLIERRPRLIWAERQRQLWCWCI